jgi:hypothetical protein
MALKGYHFATAEGHAIRRRAIGFLEEILEEEEQSSLDAKSEFDCLETGRERDVRKKFDHWLSGGRNDKWFHGWPNDAQVKECFCFKWDHKRQHHRFYGFLYHPQPKTNSPFQICVLAYHDVKNDESTNRNLLLNSMTLRTDARVRMAISFVFPDEEIKAKRQIQ